jgi:DNA repair exonuclease SbcCD ATPase subunit
MGNHLITIFVVAAIIVATVASWRYTIKARDNNILFEKRRIIDSLPNIISTLGVIGTFLGITIGLIDFNPSPDKIDASISTLLGGLKTAFFTSLAGMTGSLLLRYFVTDKIFDEQEEGVSSAEQASMTICKEIESMSQQMIAAIRSSSDSQTQMLKEMISIKSSQMTFFNSMQSQLEKISSQNIDAMNTNFETLVLLNRNQDTNISSIKASINETNRNVAEVLETENAIASIQQNQLDEAKKYSELLRAEVDEIELKMTETNKLLTAKFDEFSELLQKSNTEALVEVMKKVTEEFQKQMNQLISKLVQENFEQLNNSVENLNVWQQENKNMISQLTVKYKQMTEEFGNTSSLLSAVANDTNNLVSDGGRLSQLIKQLNKVMIDDKKFIEIASKLEQSASLTKDSISKLDQSNKSLDSWIQKHKSFVDKVEKLIAKLEELDKMRDYNDQFWKDTKKGMNEGIGIITKGAESLNSQLKELDQQFYARLSTTLGELDTCIQAMVNKK